MLHVLKKDIKNIHVVVEIPLKLVVPHIHRLLAVGGIAVVLIKPQFEVGKKFLNKKGVDIVKTTVADAYFVMFYEDLPDGASYVVWVAPADGEGKAVIEDMVYTDYVNIKWNVAVKEVTHSDITLTAEVAGASKFIINAVAESSYNSEWNPMSFDDYMNAPMGGPWNGFKSYGAAEALGLVVNVEDVPAEFKLSEILGEQLAFGENYKIWVMPVFDHLAVLDEATSASSPEKSALSFCSLSMTTEARCCSRSTMENGLKIQPSKPASSRACLSPSSLAVIATTGTVRELPMRDLRNNSKTL